MKIATVSEGQTEFACLPPLLSQIAGATGHTLLKPLSAPIPPNAPIPRIVRECLKTLRLVAIRKPDLVVFLIDREQALDLPGDIASQIEAGILDASAFTFEVRVVIKDRMFENWLIADPDALSAQPGRFKLTDSLRRRVAPDKADRVGALEYMKQAAVDSQYDKVNDGKRTAAKLSIDRAAKNSRSFRHLLHILGHPSYDHQCKRPA